jgi:predicted DNA binding CopG/RHH family protein
LVGSRLDRLHRLEQGQTRHSVELKPSSQTISIRLPKPMLERLKILANKRDVPYQSLLKIFVADRLKSEFKF